ncbi:MAG: hypothetical protein ACFFDN_46500 [Candidatus Hodarchaeota archaeon]
MINSLPENTKNEYWLDSRNFDLDEAFSFNLSPKDKRQIRKIIFEHFEYIEHQWDELHKRYIK